MRLMMGRKTKTRTKASTKPRPKTQPKAVDQAVMWRSTLCTRPLYNNIKA